MFYNFFQVLKIVVIGVVMLLTVACSSTIGNQYIKTDEQGVVTSIKRYYRFAGNEYLVMAELNGTARLAKDGVTFSSLPAHSVILINDLSNERVLKMSTETSAVNYVYTEQAIEHEVSSEIIKSMMTGLFNHTPLAAQARVDALLKYQGLDAVLKQVSSSQNDNTKAAYVRNASKLSALNEHAKLTLINVIATINSDFEQARMMQYFMQAQPAMNDELWQSFIETTQNMSSDHDLAQLLQTMALQLSDNEKVHRTFFEAIDTVDSDYEKYRLLSSIALQQNNLKLVDIIAASDDISSDYESYRLVNDLAGEIKDQYEFNALMSLIGSISSDYEMYRALTSLPIAQLSITQVTVLLELATQQIGSDYDLANTLVYLAQQTPLKEQLNAQFKQALATISSDSDRVRVYDAL